MGVESKQHRMQDRSVNEVVDDLEEQELVRWYRRWRNEPWTYAVVKSIQKIPFYLLVLVVVSWEKIKPLFEDPFLYVKEKGPLLLVSFFLFTVLFHFAWRSKAMSYYLRAKVNGRLELRDDDRVSTYGRRASVRLVAKYYRWGQHKWLLSAILAMAVPITFFAIFYLIHGLRENQWSVQAFRSIFEEGTDVFVFAVFFFFGALLGYGIQKEIKQNFHLMQKAKASREF